MSEKVEKKEKKAKTDKKEKKDKKEKPVEAPATTATAADASVVDTYVENFEKNQSRVEDVCKTFPNNTCADCNATGTRWASVNHGVFVCIRCSGIHRSVGVHISKVKSTNMDKWTAAEVDMMESIGNRRGKELYEANLPKNHKVHNGTESDNVMREFIIRKYSDKAFATTGIADILKKIGKATGYTSKTGRPKHHHHSDATTSSAAPGEPKKAGHSDPMAALYGTDSVLKTKKAKEASAKKHAKPIDGVFGPCTCTSDVHDEKRKAVLALFGFIEAEPTTEVAAAAAAQ